MSRDRLESLVGRTIPFLSLPLQVQRQVAVLLREQTLSAEELLSQEGEQGKSLFVVVEGSLGITKQDREGRSVSLGSVGPGEVTGELALLTGHPRLATIVAKEPSLIASLSHTDFELLLARFPQEMETVLRWMQQRLHRYQILSAIHRGKLFSNFQPDTKIAMMVQFQWTELQAGDVLFRKGEIANHLFLIVSGRIQTVDTESDESGSSSEQVRGEFGKGDVLGAMSIITGEPYPSTACAIRDTQVGVLDRAAFNLLVSKHPQEILGAFARRMTSQANAHVQGKIVSAGRPSTLAMLVYSPNARTFVASITQALSAFGSTLHLNQEILSTLFPSRGLSADATATRLLSWLNEQETTWTRIVYETAASEEAWAHRCLRQADLLLVIAEADTQPGEVMFSVRSLLQRTRCRAETNLILLHPAGSEMPHQTKTWLQGVDFKRHWHARIGNKEDAQRIARFLDHRAVGLVLGGGLALGLAHIGVIEALRDLRIPVDYVGGTSIGAIVGITYALGYPQSKIAEILRDGCKASLKGDYTLPVVSLLSGKKMARSVSEYVREYDLEDLWLPYFAISASLVHAKMIVHKRGSALRSVLASSRFPGLFPPLGWDQDVLVDGGLVNNVPCDVMRAELGPGTVIGVDVSRGLDFSVTEQFDLHHSGWQMARRRINPFSTKLERKNTTLASILQRIVRLGGVAHLHQVRSTADLYLIPPLHDFGFRDFHRGEEIAHVAHDYVIGLLEDWMNLNGRPWDGSTADS